MKDFKTVLAAFFGMLLCVAVFAEEKVLFSSGAKADLDGYDYVSNFEMSSDSGYFRKSSFKILEPTERGIRFIAFDIPKDVSTSYNILAGYPSFLNADGAEAGFIYNVKCIKSIKIEATTNRPYDEVILLYKTSPTGEVKKIKMPQDFNAVKSMEDFTLEFNNPAYIEDPAKRDLKASPVLGSEADGLYLVGFQIKTNAPNGYNTYSPYSAFYLRRVSVVYDKMFTDEQVENGRALREEFGISPNTEAENKAKLKIAEKSRLRQVETELMDKEQSDSAK